MHKLHPSAGYNSNGVLGNGDTVHAAFPVSVSGNHRFTDISAGSFHACALRTDGNAFCWGV
jgi:alpha-tubulin suppressor-like RCC1 family protein